MRIQGNVYPENITVESYLPVTGMVEVRLRENVNPLSNALYEYDEYIMLMKDRPGLKADITANLSDWLATLRTLEVNENASAFMAVKDENAELLEGMAQMVDEVYQSDMEMMGL